MLSINLTELIWTIINFFLLLFVLKRFLFTPVARFMDERQARVDAAAQAEREARAARDENAEHHEAEKREARQEARRMLDEAGKAAAAENAAALQAAKARAAGERQQAEEALRRESDGELDSVRLKKRELAEALARKLLEEEAET